jgi:hypothetical protein
MDTGGFFPGGKAAGKLTLRLHLVPGLRIVELYLRSPIRLHDVVFNYFTCSHFYKQSADKPGVIMQLQIGEETKQWANEYK